jgi:hypothetical protein
VVAASTAEAAPLTVVAADTAADTAKSHASSENSHGRQDPLPAVSFFDLAVASDRVAPAFRLASCLCFCLSLCPSS